jgi:hypothetical protein
LLACNSAFNHARADIAACAQDDEPHEIHLSTCMASPSCSSLGICRSRFVSPLAARFVEISVCSLK